MSGPYVNRQHDVNSTMQAARSPAGQAFTQLVLEVAWLGGLFTAAGESLARLADQSLADLLVRDGFAVYLPNPADRRAQLLQPTARGHDVLHTISIAQKAWADALGAEMGEAKLHQLPADIATV